MFLYSYVCDFGFLVLCFLSAFKLFNLKRLHLVLCELIGARKLLKQPDHSGVAVPEHFGPRELRKVLLPDHRLLALVDPLAYLRPHPRRRVRLEHLGLAVALLARHPEEGRPHAVLQDLVHVHRLLVHARQRRVHSGALEPHGEDVLLSLEAGVRRDLAESVHNKALEDGNREDRPAVLVAKHFVTPFLFGLPSIFAAVIIVIINIVIIFYGNVTERISNIDVIVVVTDVANVAS